MSDWPNLFFTEKAQIVLAGAAGGIVRWLTLRQGWRDGGVAIIVGALCSLYLSPAVMPLMNPLIEMVVSDPIQRATFAGFVVGIGGIGVVGFILDLLKSWRKEHKSNGKNNHSSS